MRALMRALTHMEARAAEPAINAASGLFVQSSEAPPSARSSESDSAAANARVSPAPNTQARGRARLSSVPVSYTHLDVYKRQLFYVIAAGRYFWSAALKGQAFPAGSSRVAIAYQAGFRGAAPDLSLIHI